MRKGQSLGAIWANHGDELPVCERTGYLYQQKGLLTCANIEHPRIVRVKVRKKGAPRGTERVDRSGRTYDDFVALPIEEQVRVAQADSVEGFKHNFYDLLSIRLVAAPFHLYQRKAHASSDAVVDCLDALERILGSPEAFSALLDPMLADRGSEFDDFEGIERSCLVPNTRRCRLYYCDAMAANQKAQVERGHEELRRILPKGRSDFDALGDVDVAAICSHVNSYPLPSRGGRCAFDCALGIVPQELLGALGLARIAPDDVVLRPSLVPHAVKQ